MKFWKSISALGLIGANIFCLPCKAMMRIPGRFPTAVSGVHVPPTTPLVFYSQNRDFSKGFDIAAIRPVVSRVVLQSSDVSMIIPQDMRETRDAGVVAGRIIDQSLTTWFKSDSIQNSSIGRTAQSFEDTLGSDMSVGGEDPDSTKHNFKFNVRAAQTKAQLDYEGLTNARLSYQVASAILDFEVREPMAMLATDLVFNHTTTRDDSRDIISVRWKW